MVLFLQQILDGLASGAIYGALALALVLIYRATHIVNFGQGEMATFSAYLAWQLCEWGVPVGLSLLIVAILSFGLGVAVFWLVVRPIYRAPSANHRGPDARAVRDLRRGLPLDLGRRAAGVPDLFRRSGGHSAAFA